MDNGQGPSGRAGGLPRPIYLLPRAFGPVRGNANRLRVPLGGGRALSSSFVTTYSIPFTRMVRITNDMNGCN